MITEIVEAYQAGLITKERAIEALEAYLKSLGL